MAKVLEPLTTFLEPAFIAFWVWLGRPGFNPATWSPLTWSLVVFALLLLTLGFRWARRRKTSTFPAPQLIISKGNIVQLENSILQQLSFKVSNLGDYSVQLLELTLQGKSMPEPVVIEAIELLRPHEASELTAILPTDLVGDSGVLKAYAYVARNSKHIYELRATLEWEPWNKRYKISPLGQTLRPTRALSSTRLDRLRKRAWLEYNPHLRPDPPGGRSSGAPKTADERRNANSKRPDLEFPNEF